MRPFLIAWAFTASMSPHLWAQSWTQQAIPLAERSHDFGTVARAAATEHRFEIRNIHQQKMHIRSVRTSCGCTTPIIENEWVEPGQAGTILARFNTGTHTGQRGATITVTIDQPVFTEVQLNVKGYIRSDVVFTPGEINFGVVAEGDAKKAEVYLDYAGRSDWAISKVSTPNESISATAEEVSREGGRVRYKILVKLSGHAPIGFMQNHLILSTNDRRLMTVPLRLFADVRPPLTISPKTVALGALKLGEPVQKRLLLKSDKPFKVTDVTSQDMDVQFDPTLESKPVQFLNVTIAPSLDLTKEGDIKSSVKVTTDLEGEKSVEMDVNYRVQNNSKTVSTAPAPPN